MGLGHDTPTDVRAHSLSFHPLSLLLLIDLSENFEHVESTTAKYISLVNAPAVHINGEQVVV